MASILKKTVVATGASSGIGFELVKQLLSQPSQPYRFILGARDAPKAQAAFENLKFDGTKHDVSVLPRELANLREVKTFGQGVHEKLGSRTPIDYLLLNAGMVTDAGPGPNGSKWGEQVIVNHFSQHYLTHLLREKLVASKARIVIVSSGAVRNNDPSKLEEKLKANSDATRGELYRMSKFVQLLGAHWWRRELAGQCVVVAVSPGLIPGSDLARNAPGFLSKTSPDAKSVPEGARSVLAAFTRSDFPADPDQIFLTSWGEWWDKSVYEPSLDHALQDKWSPSVEQIEREEGITA